MQLEALILGLLVEADGDWVSGQYLCGKLDLSRAQVLARIDSLRLVGFPIHASPGRGYRLEGFPDSLGQQQVDPLLATVDLGRWLKVHDELDSTNDEAHRLADAGAAHGTVVTAEPQTKGRGRRGRAWVSPPGKNLAMSVVLRPKLPPARASELSIVAAVAVCEAARELGAEHAKVKWPNDIECEGKKLAGLLAELRMAGDEVSHVVLGIGLNVNLAPEDLPEELRPLATSLSMERGEPVARSLACARVLGALEDWLEVHELQGFEPVRERWKELSSTLGRRVRVEGNHALEGEAVDLEPDGALSVLVGEGQRVRVVAGDVEHLRTV
ncbi:MAG: biotin--[acetyl-CoA-carboxylase] ligase [Deltaproteobacteria bacterium]|nr:biotin--[acetyl-CoA-carboxylase] ligase [Deltaproteobacteria bacterium]